MPDVKMPDGQVVEMPDELTPELAKRLRAMQADSQHSHEEYEDPRLKDVPKPYGQNNPKRSPVKDTSSFLDKAKGAVEAGLATLTSAPAAVLGGMAGAYNAATSGKYGTQEGVREAQGAAEAVGQAFTYEPRSAKGQEYTEKVGQAVNDSGVTGLPIGAEMAAMGRMAGPAAGQAARAAGSSTEAAIASKLARKVGNANVLPKLEPEKAELAQKALDMGIKIPPHMLSNNEFVRMAGEFVDNLPLSGSTKPKNRAAFNDFLYKQIGGEENVKALTPGVFGRAQRRAGKVIGDTFASITVPGNEPALGRGMAKLDESLAKEVPDVQGVVKAYLADVQKIVQDNNGTLPGTTLKKLHSEVLAKLRTDLTKYPGLKDKLNQFTGLLEDAADTQIKDPAVKAAYQTARVQYAKSKVLEPLVANNDMAGVKPSDLLGRMTATAEGKHRMATQAAGELGDAAAIAQNFIKEETNRHAVGRGAVLGAGAVLAGPVKATVGLAASNLYNRFGPRITKRIIENSRKEGGPAKPTELALEE